MGYMIFEILRLMLLSVVFWCSRISMPIITFLTVFKADRYSNTSPLRWQFSHLPEALSSRHNSFYPYKIEQYNSWKSYTMWNREFVDMDVLSSKLLKPFSNKKGSRTYLPVTRCLLIFNFILKLHDLNLGLIVLICSISYH